jgi:hypothetical protein
MYGQQKYMIQNGARLEVFLVKVERRAFLLAKASFSLGF